jgi:ribonuclease Z
MTRLVQCTLVNDPFSDPGLFIDFCFGRRALLFDLGDLTPLSPRQLLRVSHAFVSHAHMDHFVGFDRLLRVCLHRTMPLHLVGPAGFADRVEHKLKAYTLDLLGEHSCDFVITVAEFNGERFDRLCEFHARETFRQREVSSVQFPPGTLLDEDEFRIDSVVLDHGTPCLAFAFEEKLRVNVWREGLKLLRLPVGPWLSDAKRAVRRGAPDDSEIVIRHDQSIPLGVLKQHALHTARGQKIAFLNRLVAYVCTRRGRLIMVRELTAEKDHALTLGAAGSSFQKLRLSEMVLNDCLVSWVRMAYPMTSRCTRAASFCSVSRNMCSSAISFSISCTEVPDMRCTSEPT